MEPVEELLLEVRVCQQELDQVVEWIADSKSTTNVGAQEFAPFSDFIGTPFQSTLVRTLSPHWSTKLDLTLDNGDSILS